MPVLGVHFDSKQMILYFFMPLQTALFKVLHHSSDSQDENPSPPSLNPQIKKQIAIGVA